MYKYLCKSVGDCRVADSGEPITSETLLNDPRCSECANPLVPVENNSATRGAVTGNGGKAGLLIAVAAAVVLAGGGSWYLISSKAQPDQTSSVAIAAPSTSAELVQENKPTASVSAESAPLTGITGVGISPSEAETSKARRESDQKLGNGEFSEAEKRAARAAALEMIKTAVAKLGQGDLVGAERELMQARERDATESLIYYNLAIVRLRQQQPDEALRQLEAAFMAGFSHFDAMDKDSDMDSLRADPRFRKLLSVYRRNT